MFFIFCEDLLSLFHQYVAYNNDKTCPKMNEERIISRGNAAPAILSKYMKWSTTLSECPFTVMFGRLYWVTSVS